MANDSGGGEKTEEPTSERLRRLREDGNVPKSQDINSAAKFLVVFCLLSFLMPYLASNMMLFSRQCITAAFDSVRGQMQPGYINVIYQGMITMGKEVAPIFALEFLAAIALNVAQVGFIFSTKPITPDINRINPATGFKNLFNMKKMVELLKTIAKFIAISYFSYITIKKYLKDIVLICRSDLQIGLKIVGYILWDLVIKVSVVFLIIAFIDMFYQRRRYFKDNRMTKHEVKQEYKQSEGDPQHKQERRKLHQEILSGPPSGGGTVALADAVVRNPDHIAVAIRYDAQKSGAPVVLAKGERLWAKKILQEAERFGIPMVHNVPLAQALNKVMVGSEIPEELYKAVAEVLTFVYSLKQHAQKGK